MFDPSVLKAVASARRAGLHPSRSPSRAPTRVEMALVIRNRAEPVPLRSSRPLLRSKAATTVDHPQAGSFADPGQDAARAGFQRYRNIRRGWLVRRMLLAADVAGLLAAFFATELIFLGNRLIDNVGIGEETLIFMALMPAWIVAAKLYGLYDRD